MTEGMTSQKFAKLDRRDFEDIVVIGEIHRALQRGEWAEKRLEALHTALGEAKDTMKYNVMLCRIQRILDKWEEGA